MIEQIKQAIEKATPGKWRMSALAGGYLMTDDFPNKELATFIEYTKDGQVYIEFENWRNNAHLIANAPEWLRYLIGEVERLEREFQHSQRNMKMAVSSMEHKERQVEQLQKALEAIE